jgi:hypothetical protein
MARCYLTGVGISLDEAFVLDLTVAHRVLRDLRERLATLERLTAQLGEKDSVTIQRRGSSGSHTRQDRRVVSKSVATALSDACADAELFVPWGAWRTRGRTFALAALRQHPDYALRLRDLDETRMMAVLDLASEVLRRLAPGQTLGPELRDAVTAGVCVTLAHLTAEEIVVMLRDRTATDADMTGLGVPSHIEPALRRALASKPDEWGQAE